VKRGEFNHRCYFYNLRNGILKKRLLFCLRTLQEFNEQVYTGKDRSMMFATVVGYPGEGQRCMCLELNPADPMTDLEALNAFFLEVKNTFQYNDENSIFTRHRPFKSRLLKTSSSACQSSQTRITSAASDTK
jgi:hypothetical protein